MIALTINDPSQIAEARRAAQTLAQQHDFGAGDAGRVALVATELATNLLKHAGGGEMLVGPCEVGPSSGVEILALDKGPGMADVQACLADGYSNAGTQGNGLGAVSRQSQFVSIASWPGLGTAVLARLLAGKRNSAGVPPVRQVGAVAVAKLGEEVCGDSWTVAQSNEVCTLFVADGLGHGPDAAHASAEAVRVLHRFGGHQVQTVLDYVHGGLRATRGAAVSIARFDPAAGKVSFAGVGNVAGVLAVNGELRRMVSMPGTLGYNVRKIQAFEYPFANGLVILHSDGLSTGWTLGRYTNLEQADPTLIAGVLYRDFARRRDDVTILIGKWPAG
ncbi:MAG TPA: ATP-binding SpoIIE family protein phosphatase [Xanthobacteraceae bacterium]|nr:ATP-binding SpoIIE family protein phosphatase [Xanthobacteraceae bacterium]